MGDNYTFGVHSPPPGRPQYVQQFAENLRLRAITVGPKRFNRRLDGVVKEIFDPPYQIILLDIHPLKVLLVRKLWWDGPCQAIAVHKKLGERRQLSQLGRNGAGQIILFQIEQCQER
jgi:hypothetical protein